MSDHSKIEWTDATWNPVTGCSVLSSGCTNCYAMKLAGTRLRNHPSRAGLTNDSKAGPVWNGQVRFNEEWLAQPLSWRKPRMVFVCAHGDLFHEAVPDAWIDKVFDVMALAPQHTFQVLTKRAKRMRAYLSTQHDESPQATVKRFAKAWLAGSPVPENGITVPLPNVWLGVSAERQQEAEARIPELLATPAAQRFISGEPLLGPLNLAPWLPFIENDPNDPRMVFDEKVVPGGIDLEQVTLDWVIVGGESGDQARPMSIQWARELRDQCRGAGVPFFFKQWGEWRPAGFHASGTPGHFAFGDYEHDRSAMIQVDAYPRQFTKFGARSVMQRVGKKAAGRLLDGVEHGAMPARVGR